MTQPNASAETIDSLFSTIIDFLLPFFLTSAAGNADAARATISDLINAYNASTTAELDLVGRIVGFSIAAIDNLRLSMTPELSDAKILRYRANAVTLSRASDQARKILEALQTNQPPRHQVPRPTVAAAPAPKPTKAAPSSPVIAAPTIAAPGIVPPATRRFAPMEIDAMKRDARALMTAFSKSSVQSSVAMPTIPNPGTLINAAATAAIAAARRTSA